MRLWRILAVLAGLASAAGAEGLPSGQVAELYDLVIEPETGTARFRFLMPGLDEVDYAQVAGDLPWLCARVALPEMAANGWTAEVVVISIGDRMVPLGQMDAEAVQYFDAFAVADGTCILEVF